MRRNVVIAVAGLGLMGAFGVRQAAAFPATHCSTGALTVCAAVDASTYKVGTQWHLVLDVWNLFDGTPGNGLSSVITYVGMGSSGFTGTGALFSAKYNGGAVSWVTANTIPSNPVGANIDMAAAGTNGINHGLIGCSQTIQGSQLQTCYHNTSKALVLDFTTSAQFVLTDPTAMYGWHAQDVGTTGCSLWVGSNGTQTSPVNADGSACGGSVVPEPATMLLLGTGLTGLTGLMGLGRIRLRRRGKNEVVESA